MTTTARKVLIADDEPNILLSLEFLMKREGHQVLLARDGNEALDAIRRERPDLVLLDVMMPGRSGFDVCQAVRADEALAGVKIVLLTAKGRDTDIAKGMALGATEYMTKPFSTKELAARVRALLGLDAGTGGGTGSGADSGADSGAGSGASGDTGSGTGSDAGDGAGGDSGGDA